MTSRRSLIQQALGLVVWLGLCYAAAAIGAIASADAPAFYAQLTKPDWAPPAKVFGPVWSTLYTLMGIAAWLVWREGPSQRVKAALTLFVVQLGVNALWSWLFFAWHMGGFAFVEVVLLALLIASTIVLFWRVRRVAGVLLVPYLLWVSFASALTLALWRANPATL